MPKADNVDSWTFEESPCEALFPHIARCGAQLLACAAFHSFIQHGGRRWRGELREPSAEAYRKIYGADSDAGRLAA
jgi:hypothetical protein